MQAFFSDSRMTVHLQRARRLAALSIALIASSLAFSVSAQQGGDAPSAPARVIVKFRPDASMAKMTGGRAKALTQRVGRTLGDGPAIAERAQVVTADSMTSREPAQRLAQDSDVEYAVPDERRRAMLGPDDPLYASVASSNGPAVGQWYLRAPAGEVAASIDVETAWKVTQGAPDVVVADLDTGVRFDPPALLSAARGGRL